MIIGVSAAAYMTVKSSDLRNLLSQVTNVFTKTGNKGLDMWMAFLWVGCALALVCLILAIMAAICKKKEKKAGKKGGKK